MGAFTRFSDTKKPALPFLDKAGGFSYNGDKVAGAANTGNDT